MSFLLMGQTYWLLCRSRGSDLSVISGRETSWYSEGDGVNSVRRAQVVILDGRSLLGESAAQLLRHEDDFDVTIVPYLNHETSLRSLLDQVPDIILIDGGGPFEPEDILKLLMEQSALMNVRLIYVHDEDNTIEVFQRRSIVATHSHDLVALVRGIH